jgi:acetyl esterase/lipase
MQGGPSVRPRNRGRRSLVCTLTALASILGLLGCSDDDAVRSSVPVAAPAGTVASTADQAVTQEYLPGLAAVLHRPDDPVRAPLLVMVPGGAWLTADPAGFDGLARQLARSGVVALPVEVRAADDDVVYPVPVADVLCALAYGVATARAHGIEPGPLIVLGHSSGAHLAALAVLAPAEHAADCPYPPVTPDALVGLAGTYDVEAVPELAGELFGVAPADDPGLWEAGNPLSRAGLRPDVPVLLVHGDADDLVPMFFTTEFAQALEAAGHPTTVEVIAGADHHEVYSADASAGIIATWSANLDP